MSKQYLNLPISVKMIHEPESKDAPYVAYSPELDVSSCNKTEEGARKNLIEAIQILFEEAERKNQLSELLEEVGFSKKKNTWFIPQVSFQQILINLRKSQFHAQNFSYSLQ